MSYLIVYMLGLLTIPVAFRKKLWRNYVDGNQHRKRANRQLASGLEDL